MAITCAIFQCCNDPSIRAYINASQGNWPSPTVGQVYYITYAGKEQCFEVVYVSSPCAYSGSYGYYIPATAIFTGPYVSCANCNLAVSPVDTCDEVLIPIPTPSPTPTSSITPTPTPTPSVTPSPSNTPAVLTRFVADKCCDIGVSLILSSYDTIVVGDIVLYNGDCYEVISLNPPGGGPKSTKQIMLIVLMKIHVM